jgi:hypothetical protein
MKEDVRSAGWEYLLFEQRHLKIGSTENLMYGSFWTIIGNS